MKDLQEQLESGRPMERKIFDIASRQASSTPPLTEGLLHMRAWQAHNEVEKQTLRDENTKAAAELKVLIAGDVTTPHGRDILVAWKEKDKRLSTLRQSEAALKAQIRELTSSSQRAGPRPGSVLTL